MIATPVHGLTIESRSPGTVPVSALIETSETPKRIPAAAPSSTPWRWRMRSTRCESSSSDPITIIAPSKAIIPEIE